MLASDEVGRFFRRGGGSLCWLNAPRSAPHCQGALVAIRGTLRPYLTASNHLLICHQNPRAAAKPEISKLFIAPSLFISSTTSGSVSGNCNKYPDRSNNAKANDAISIGCSQLHRRSRRPKALAPLRVRYRYESPCLGCLGSGYFVFR